jgi:hypothetical protein
MINSNYTITICVNKNPQQVYDAINNVNAWWQGEINGFTHQLHDEFEYKMEEFHLTKQKIIETIPNKKMAGHKSNI